MPLPNVRATCCHSRNQTGGTETCTRLPPLCLLPRGHEPTPTAFSWCAGPRGLQPWPHFRPAQPAGTRECFPAPTQLYSCHETFPPPLLSMGSASPHKQNPSPPWAAQVFLGQLYKQTQVGSCGAAQQGGEAATTSWQHDLGAWSPSIIKSLCVWCHHPLMQSVSPCPAPHSRAGMEGSPARFHPPGSRSHQPVSSAAPR